MRILIHCNGGPAIGVGHVVRSLALVEEALAAGHDVTVAGEFDGEFVSRLVSSTGVCVRPVARGNPQGLAAVAEEIVPDVLHLDTYEVIDVASCPIRTVPLISNMQDAHFGRRAAQLAIDPNFGADAKARNIATHSPVSLRGSRYAPLRAKVVARRGEWQLRHEARRVLVVMGGSDPRNLTPLVLDALAATHLPLRVTAITHEEPRVFDLGAMAVEMIPPIDDLAALIPEQDMVVSAAGTTVWELCCVGVPAALVCVVDNQRVSYERLVTAGAVVGLGIGQRDLRTTAAARALRATLEDAGTRQDLARHAAAIVDGRGACRIVREWERLFVGDGSERRGRDHN